MSAPATPKNGATAAVRPDAQQTPRSSATPQWNNFCEAFAATVARHATRTAVEVQRRDTVEAVPYQQLARMAEQARARFASKGLGPGDRCVILAENDARWCAAFLGILEIGAVAVPLDTNYAPKQIARLLQDSGARLLGASARMEAAARQAAAQVGAGCVVLPLGGGESPEREDGANRLACPAAREDPAVILYTSGTTSDPKGVVLTHGNLLAEQEGIVRSVWLDERDALLGVLPLYHALALVTNLLLPFLIGGRVVYLETMNTTELLRALEERDITALCCVPQFFYLIHERVRQQLAAAGAAKRAAFRLLLRLNAALRRLGLNLGPRLFARVHRVLGPRMRLLVTGGSRFDPAIGRELYGMGFNIMQAYGLTECTGGATVTRPGDPAVETVGQPIYGVEVKIGPRGEAAEAGVQDGEVMLRGPIIMPGYYNRPDATAETLRDGWLMTGDLGVLDARGRLRITGRKKEIIVLSSGKNIYPEEIESHYLHSAYVKELCVMGLERPGEPSAERLHAVVVPNQEVMRERKVVNMREVLRFEIESMGVALPSHKRVLSFEVWTHDLPRTTTRKLKRYEIAARAHERAAAVAAAGPGAARAEGARVLSESDAAWCALPEVARALEVIAQAGKEKTPVAPDANIELQMGLDSMERVELLTQLEEMFGTSVPDDVRQKIYTVRELVEAVLPKDGSAAGAWARTGDAWGRLLAAGPGGVPEDDPVLEGLLEEHALTSAALFTGTRILRAAARVLFGLRITGVENFPREGTFLLSPNHQGFLDMFLLAGALPWSVFRRMFFVGASEYYATPLRLRMARAVHVIPVDPDANLVRAMQAGAFGLRHGKVLVLFPEGERTVDGEIKTFKKGAAILSLHLRAPIVPVAIRGSFEFWPRARGFQWKRILPGGGRIRIAIGAPLPPPEPLAAGGDRRGAEERYAAATDTLRAAVDAMWQRL
ncbi:MAG TPA: AMP-binding protein [Candidatus Acidoferrales bacterium]|nr:AMP-binding protein [Candidatus Acidoferrales bacterium]